MDDLKINVGDTLRIVSTGPYSETDKFYVGKEFIVDGRDESGTLFSNNLHGGYRWYILPEQRHMYKIVTEKEDDVLSELKIKAGDKIQFIEDGLDVTAGKEYMVEGIDNDDIYFTDDAGERHYWSYPSNSYEVISESSVMNGKELSNEELTDLIVKLSKNLASIDKRLYTLEEREDSISNDLRTLGEEGAETAYDVDELRGKLDEHIDMFIEDISMLDERTMNLRNTDTEDKTVEAGANEEHDAISPSHYRYGGIEVIDYIDQVCHLYGGEQASYVANVIKYVSRSPLKNGAEDLRKARWYLDRLIGKTEQGEIK